MATQSRIDRRQFVGGSTGLITGVLATGSPLGLFAPSRAWALDLGTLSTIEGETLLAMVRTIAPHDGLDDAAYAFVVKAVDAEAGRTESARRRIVEGLAGLGAGFGARPEPERVSALKMIESSAFFEGVRLTTLQVLYSTPLAYAYFGYEGEAFSKGGYLTRGFNDLRWLPEVPEEDAGRVPGEGSPTASPEGRDG